MQIIMVAASDWVTKYFIAASSVAVDLFINKIGVTEIKLITRPIHSISQFEEEITIMVPRAVEEINSETKVGEGRLRVVRYSGI